MVCTQWRWQRKSCAQWAARSRRYLWPTLSPEQQFTFAPSSQSCFLQLLPQGLGKSWRQKRKIDFVLFFSLLLTWKKSLYFKCQLFLLLTTGRIKQEALLNMNQPMSHLVIRYQWHTFVCGISTLLTMNILTVNMTRCHCLHYSSMEKTLLETLLVLQESDSQSK